MNALATLINEAIEAGHLVIERVPAMSGARTPDYLPQRIPEQLVLRANLGGSSVRVHSIPLMSN